MPNLRTPTFKNPIFTAFLAVVNRAARRRAESKGMGYSTINRGDIIVVPEK